MSRTLEGVKVGDTLVCQRSIGSAIDVFRVERLTKTLVVCGTQSFARDSGKMRGTNSWNSRWARIPTDEDLAAVEMQNRIRRAELALDRMKITADNLEVAEAFIAASQPKAQP